ncbi:MAG: MATE family efflux transporter [Reinekea sp.]
MTKSFISLAIRQQGHKTWHLAWPVIVANLSLPLLNLADVTILGHLDSSVYLAAIAAGSSLFAYIFWGFNFLQMGLSGFTSQAYGRKDISEIFSLLKRYSAVALALIVAVLLLHRPMIAFGLALVDPPAEVATEAQIYLQIRMLGVPAIVLNSMLLGFFVGLQNTRISLYSISLTQVLNIALNLFFVFGLDYAIKGIALGTVISEYSGLALILWQLRRTLIRLKPAQHRPARVQWHWSAYRPIFQVSSNLFIRSFALLSSFVWFNRMMADAGSTELAANALLLSFFTLISGVLDGTAAAAEAQTGQGMGRSDSNYLKQIWLVSGLMNLMFMIGLSLFLLLAGSTLVELMSNQEDIITTAIKLMPLIALLPITGGIAFWLDGICVGARQSLAMRNSVLIGFFLCRYLIRIFF